MKNNTNNFYQALLSCDLYQFWIWNSQKSTKRGIRRYILTSLSIISISSAIIANSKCYILTSKIFRHKRNVSLIRKPSRSFPVFLDWTNKKKKKTVCRNSLCLDCRKVSRRVSEKNGTYKRVFQFYKARPSKKPDGQKIQKPAIMPIVNSGKRQPRLSRALYCPPETVIIICDFDRETEYNNNCGGHINYA